MDSGKPLRERDPLVGARVAQAIIDGLDAMAARLRSENPNERSNRSSAIRTCFEATETIFRGERLEMLRAWRAEHGGTIIDAIDALCVAGFGTAAFKAKRRP